MNLLFPNGKEKITKLSEESYRHLAVEELVDLIGVTTEDKQLLRETLSLVPGDMDTTKYRQEILADFLKDDSFDDDLSQILGQLDVLKEYRMHGHFTTQKKASLWDMIDYMEEMDVYIKIVEGMIAFFQKHKVTSTGLKQIADLLQDVVDEDRVGQLKEIVESQKAEVSSVKSILVGINLTPELRPEEVIVLGYENVPYQSPFEKVSWGMSMASRRMVRYREPSQFMKYISEDLEKELSKTVQKNKKRLKEFINFKGYFLLDICNDLKYYLLLSKFAKKLIGAGFAICMPKLIENSDYVKMQGIYNLRLITRQLKADEIVQNDFVFSEQEKLFILTGPNRGGKTMLTQAVGINALFAAQGLFVAGNDYEGYTFEDILTHFPADENETLDLGRLGEEAVRVQTIVRQANPKTLVLLNETYSSTSAFDGLYLSNDLVHILKHKNVPMIFNTHIHDLACNTEKMNEWDGPSSVASITMEIVDNVNTFRVLKKEPDRNSYARNIAEKYGVTYEQMLNE